MLAPVKELLKESEMGSLMEQLSVYLKDMNLE